MIVGSTKEIRLEKRISITPDTTKSIKSLGLNILLEKGYGENLGYTDQDYKDRGADFSSNPKEILSKSNLVCKVNLLSEDERNIMQENANLIISNLNEDDTKKILKKKNQYFCIKFVT